MRTGRIAENAIKRVNAQLIKRRKAIFTRTDLQEIVIENIRDSGVNEKILIKRRILKYLWDKEKLKEVVFEFPSRKETRYLFGEVTNFELAQSLKPNAYLEYRAAMFLNGLCDEYPQTIHINVEQSQHHKRNTNSLTQASIDQAFKNKARVSNEIAEANNVLVCVTHGQKTDRLGVEVVSGIHGDLLSVTSLERTLIDIVVRPVYAGGPKEVLKAYNKAGNLSLKKLVEMLKQMNYVYPYQQVIGFYLEASGTLPVKDLTTLRDMKSDFDFYLDYRMKNPKYSKEWQLYYPRDLI